MKILAVIAEYNPLHTGHIYHLERAKADLSPDAVVVVQSGNFTQRGDIAIAEKHKRAKAAVLAGADIVVELPFCYAVNCAEKFAEGALKTLSCFKGDITLSFGSECGDIETLKALSEKSHNETELDKQKIKQSLKEGEQLVRARAKTLDGEGIFTPNNILALEYIHSAEKYGYGLHTVKRDDNYNSTETAGKFASANAIRNNIFEGKIDIIKDYLPDYSLKTLDNCIFNKALTDLVLYKLNKLSSQEISCLAEVSEGLENRIKGAAKSSTSYADLCGNIKSKRYTMARIKRILLYSIFDFTKAVANDLYDTPPYARVLALRDGRTDLLANISENSNLIVRTRDLQNMPEAVKKALEFESAVDDVYAVLSKDCAKFNALFV